MKHITSFIASFGATVLLVSTGYYLVGCRETNSAKRLGNLIFILPVFVFPVQAIIAVLLPGFNIGRIAYSLASLLISLLFLNFYCVGNLGSSLGDLLMGGYFSDQFHDPCPDIRGPALFILILVPIALLVKMLQLLQW